ncbi:MAG: YihY/virulence factor BrkB family protein [Gemmatimonadaceae bacterium]
MSTSGSGRARTGDHRAILRPPLPQPRTGERLVYLLLHPRELASTLADYAARVWNNSGEDNVFFLAGGVAFNILLAAVPFVLVVMSGLAYVLNRRVAFASDEVWFFIQALLPPMDAKTTEPLRALLDSILSARGSIGIWSAIGFVWFAARLFGSLRTVLAEVFDIETERGIVLGKIFDLRITVISSTLLITSFALSAYLAIGRTRGAAMFDAIGLPAEVLGQLEYAMGRVIAFVFVVTAFYGLYRYLPNRKIRWKQAFVGALTAGVLFEIARNVYTIFTGRFDPGSLYTGTLYVIVSVVFWVYYAALVFIIGGEVAQVHELRRQLRMQRETFDDLPRPQTPPAEPATTR